MIKRSKGENKGIVPTEMELVLEYTQQGTSHEVLEHLKMEMEIPCSNKIKFITACSFSNDSFEDIMKAQVSVIKASATLNIQAFKIKKSVSISFRMTQSHLMAKDQMIDGKFNGMSIEINKKKELQHLEQVANLTTYPSQCFKSFCYDDDDDYDYEESTIPLNEIDSQIPLSIAITPESDEFIKSSVEDLVPIPSEFEDTSESDSDYDLLSCDDFSPINVYAKKSMTFSNPLFDLNDDFTSSDDESLSDEDVPEDNVKIYSNPLFEFDDEYISSNVNPLFDEVLENIERGEIDEIGCFFDMDISTDIEKDYHDSEGAIIYLESLLIDDTIPNLPPEVFLDHDPRSLKDELDKKDLKSVVKVFAILSLNHFVEIPSGESMVHIEVLSVLWGNRLSIPDGSLPLSK
ncbi:hypothetical protein Tco_1119710 [Tanacetum coccineum]